MDRSYQHKLLFFLSLINPLSLCAQTICKRNCETVSRSFLDVRPPFLSASPERISMFRNEQIHACKDGYHNALQIVPMGSVSLDASRTARYFSPICNQSFIVDENPAVEDKDVLSQHFNVVTKNGDFRSIISFAPKQSFVGVGFEYRHEWLRTVESNRGWWLSASTVLQYVRNTIGLCEHIINDGGGANVGADPLAVDSMTKAFDQQAWKFGHIVRGAREETGFADIEFKVGYEWLSCTPYHLESYVGLLIPTSDKANGRILFQPLVGNGRHWGFLFGSRAGFDIADFPEYGIHLRMELANHTQFLLSDHQVRALDLKNRPWSRYLALYADQAQAEQAALMQDQYLATPGINILTLPVSVKPGISNTVNTAFVATWRQLYGECGYNVWVRSADSVSLCRPWQEGPAIKALDGQGQTNPVRTIAGQELIEQIAVPLADYKSSLIHESDLDLQSATHPCTLLQTIYGVVGYTWDTRHPLFLSAGGSYMFTNAAHATAALPRWMVWGKWGIAF